MIQAPGKGTRGIMSQHFLAFPSFSSCPNKVLMPHMTKPCFLSPNPTRYPIYVDFGHIRMISMCQFGTSPSLMVFEPHYLFDILYGYFIRKPK
jgi:hypothetical protein